MVKLLNNKGQALPLNTIVIALLVVVVLVVVILAFTSNMGNTNETLQQTNACNKDNAAIASIYNLEDKDVEAVGTGTCEGDTVPGVSGVEEGQVCCITPQ